jgi:metal-responsive CopG/Arc/MetJ family transcriptional regulator
MKTAISIPDETFKEVEHFAKEHKYSRSEVFAIAIKEFLEKYKSRQLFTLLNDVHSDIEAAEDTKVREKALKHYAKRVLKEPY